MDLKWLQSDKAKRISREARAKARAGFKSEYPDGDFSKIEAEVTFDEEKTSATAEIMYKAGLLEIIASLWRENPSRDLKTELFVRTV